MATAAFNASGINEVRMLDADKISGAKHSRDEEVEEVLRELNSNDNAHDNNENADDDRICGHNNNTEHLPDYDSDGDLDFLEDVELGDKEEGGKDLSNNEWEDY